MSIHKTADIDKTAEIDSSADIGPGVNIEGMVRIAAGVRIMANVCIFRGTEIGENTVIHPGAVIGNEPQDLAYKGGDSFTRIGRGCVIREYVTIHRGTAEGSTTVIGDNNYIMVQVHLGHNCRTEDNVIIAPGSILGGYVEVEKGAFISGGVVFHQFCRIGRYAMIGGFTGVNKDVPPYMLVRGPSAIRGVNLVGLRRAGFSREAMKEIKESYMLLFKSGMRQEEALAVIKERFQSDEIAHLVAFVEASKRGICRSQYSKDAYFE